MNRVKKQPFKRAQRVGDLLARELSRSILEEVSDPRVSRTTITSVIMSDDLKHARVYFSILEDDPRDIKETAKALSKATGFFKKKIKEKLELRYIPELKFEHDPSLQRGARILSLIGEVAKTNDEDSTGDPEDD
jgi:ribosome-binding factor A